MLVARAQQCNPVEPHDSLKDHMQWTLIDPISHKKAERLSRQRGYQGREAIKIAVRGGRTAVKDTAQRHMDFAQRMWSITATQHRGTNAQQRLTEKILGEYEESVAALRRGENSYGTRSCCATRTEARTSGGYYEIPLDTTVVAHSLADGRELPATGDGVKPSRKYSLVPVRKLATPMYDPSPTGEPLGQYGTA